MYIESRKTHKKPLRSKKTIRFFYFFVWKKNIRKKSGNGWRKSIWSLCIFFSTEVNV